jgi:hypothetical protein
LYGEFGSLAPHLRWAHRATARLGRVLFHAMVRFGPGLEKRQMVLFRAVNVGAELFAMAAACVRAQQLARAGNASAREVADVFCWDARERVQREMRGLFGRRDRVRYRLAQATLRGDYAWLEDGVVEDRQYD